MSESWDKRQLLEAETENIKAKTEASMHDKHGQTLAETQLMAAREKEVLAGFEFEESVARMKYNLLVHAIWAGVLLAAVCAGLFVWRFW